MSLRISSTMRTRIDAYLAAEGYRGSLLVDTTLPDEHQRMLSDLRASAERTIDWATRDDTHRPNIYFDFVENDYEFNAFAIRMDADYFILVNTRAVVSIPALFRNLFSLPQFASHIGDPSLETLPPITTVPIGRQKDGFLKAMPFPERLPKCPVRYRAAARFAQTALNFLLLHELGHIRNGHLHFLPSGTGAMRILAEAESKAPDNRHVLADHTLENDADSHAVVHGVNSVFQLARTTAGNDPLDALYATPEHTLHSFLLPAYAVMRSLGSPDWSPDTIWEKAHPPMAIRQVLLTQLASERVARAGFNFTSPDRPFEIARDIMMEVEHGFSLLTGVARSLSDFAAAMEFWQRGYGRQITEFWVTAHPQLDRLKLGGRLAPPEPWRDGPDDAKP